MNEQFDLERFITAQDQYSTFQQAMQELHAGRKQSHWIWFIFPQLKGLGRSYNAEFYGIANLAEAKAYWEHPLLQQRLQEACQLLLQNAQQGRSMQELLGYTDARKVRSCLTLFDAATQDPIFQECLLACYNGKKDGTSLKMLAL